MDELKQENHRKDLFQNSEPEVHHGQSFIRIEDLGWRPTNCNSALGSLDYIRLASFFGELYVFSAFT